MSAAPKKKLDLVEICGRFDPAIINEIRRTNLKFQVYPLSALTHGYTFSAGMVNDKDGKPVVFVERRGSFRGNGKGPYKIYVGPGAKIGHVREAIYCKLMLADLRFAKISNRDQASEWLERVEFSHSEAMDSFDQGEQRIWIETAAFKATQTWRHDDGPTQMIMKVSPEFEGPLFLVLLVQRYGFKWFSKQLKPGPLRELAELLDSTNLEGAHRLIHQRYEVVIPWDGKDLPSLLLRARNDKFGNSLHIDSRQQQLLVSDVAPSRFHPDRIVQQLFTLHGASLVKSLATIAKRKAVLESWPTVEIKKFEHGGCYSIPFNHFDSVVKDKITLVSDLVDISELGCALPIEKVGRIETFEAIGSYGANSPLVWNMPPGEGEAGSVQISLRIGERRLAFLELMVTAILDDRSKLLARGVGAVMLECSESGALQFVKPLHIAESGSMKPDAEILRWDPIFCSFAFESASSKFNLPSLAA